MLSRRTEDKMLTYDDDTLAKLLCPFWWLYFVVIIFW